MFRFFYMVYCGGRIWTCDLRVMSPTSYRAAPPRDGNNNIVLILKYCPAASYSHRGKPPTTIGAEKLNFRVRYGNGCDLLAIATRHIFLRVVPSKLDNAEEVSVVAINCPATASSFLVVSSRTLKSKNRICRAGLNTPAKLYSRLRFSFWLSPRSISISQLHTSPRFHLWPINLIIFQGSY